jgi:hypothetical protein
MIRKIKDTTIVDIHSYLQDCEDNLKYVHHWMKVKKPDLDISDALILAEHNIYNAKMAIYGELSLEEKDKVDE